jgi:hypothetical protein
VGESVNPMLGDRGTCVLSLGALEVPILSMDAKQTTLGQRFKFLLPQLPENLMEKLVRRIDFHANFLAPWFLAPTSRSSNSSLDRDHLSPKAALLATYSGTSSRLQHSRERVKV